MVKHTLIYNEMWKGVCVGEQDKDPVQPSDKELAIWEKRNVVYCMKERMK